MIVVTAPTGQIGSQVVAALLQQQGEALRLVVRDPAKLDPEVRDHVEIVVGSHGDAEVIDAALEGAEALFWLAPADPAAPSVLAAYVGFSLPAADAVVRHRVPRVVTVSALGREAQRWSGLVSASLAADDLFRSTGAHLRALTMPSFMDNTLWQVPSIREAGVISGSQSADLPLPAAATRDIAAVAARLLVDRSWTGQDSLGVLGPEDLSSNDMAAILAEVLGVPVRYERGTLDQEKQGLIGAGYSDAMAQAMIDMNAAKDEGLDTLLQRTPENTTPTSFRQWATEVLKPAFDAA